MLQLGFSALGISAPIFVAHSRGLFEERGVPAKLVGYPTAHPLVEDVARGALACGGFVALPISLHRHVRGRALGYACAVVEDSDHPISFLLVREGAGIARLDDLAGRRVGVLPTKAYREWLKLLVARRGLGYHQATMDKTCKCMETCSALGVPKDRLVEAHDVLPAETVAALRSGRVDAVFTNDPAATAAVRSGAARVFGDRPILPSELGGPLLFGTFVVNPAFAGERPETAAKIVSALDEAIRILRQDPGAERRAAAAYVPGGADSGDGLGRPRFLTSAEVEAAAVQRAVDGFAAQGVVGGTFAVAPWILRGGDRSLPRAERGPPHGATSSA